MHERGYNVIDETFDVTKIWPKKSACNCNLDNMQSLLQVDDELDAEEPHPQLHHSEKQAVASSLQNRDSLSSDLASSEQRQGTPKWDRYLEEGNYQPPHKWPTYLPSQAAATEQSYSGGAQGSEANRGSGSSQLSSRLDWDMPLFRDPVISTQRHSYSHTAQGFGQQQQHDRFGYDHDYEYPARHRGNLYPAHPSVQQQHGHETFGFGSEMGPPGFTAAPQSNRWGPDKSALSSRSPASEEQHHQREENDNGMRPSGFKAATQSDGWGPEPSSSAAASQQNDNGMRPPGFKATPNRSMGMAAAQSGRQQQRHEEQDDPSTVAAQHTQQQHQDGVRHRYRGTRGGSIAKQAKQK